MNSKVLARLAIWPLILSVFAPVVLAGRLDPQVISLFPKNTSEFAYADLAAARQFSWFVPFETQAMPVRFHRFENFLTQPQLGIGSQIDTAAWTTSSGEEAMGIHAAPSSGDVLGVAIGQFDRQTAESYLESQKTPKVDFEGFTLFSSGSDYGGADVVFVFIDSNTVAFGSRAQVQRLLRVHNAESPSINENDSMMALINQANGTGIFWGILDAEGAQQAVRQLVPEAGKFPQAQQLIGKMTALVIHLGGSSDTSVDLSLDALSATPQDALILSQLIQAGVLLRRFQSAQENPALANILDGVSVGAVGSHMEISIRLTTDELQSLIAHDVFSVNF